MAQVTFFKIMNLLGFSAIQRIGTIAVQITYKMSDDGPVGLFRPTLDLVGIRGKFIENSIDFHFCAVQYRESIPSSDPLI